MMAALRAWWDHLTASTVHVRERRFYNGRELDPVRDKAQWDDIGRIIQENDKLFEELKHFTRHW